MFSCLPEENKRDMSTQWAQVLEAFDKAGKVEILLSRLMRTCPELGNEYVLPQLTASLGAAPEPVDPPPKARMIKDFKGVKILQATPAWWANPGDGGVYVGNGTLFCPKSNFWGDAKDKVAPDLGHQVLGKRPLYVGSEEEAWNAEELVDKWSLQHHDDVPSLLTQSDGIRELKTLVGEGLSVCSLGLVLKYLLLGRPSQFGTFARVLPTAALKTLQAESCPLLPMKLPDASSTEKRVMNVLQRLKEGLEVDQAQRAEVQRELAEVGKSAWVWLCTLALNWAHRGSKMDEVFVPYHAVDHSLAQKKVMRRIVCCVARFCVGDKRVEPQPWEEMSMKRGPGHWGTPICQAYPISWSAIKETFWSLTPAEDAKRQKFSKHLGLPQEWTRTKVEMVHRTGSLVKDHAGPLVMVESDLEWASVVKELVAREILEAEEESAGDASSPSAFCGVYGIHRSWSLASGEAMRLLSLVFDVDLVNVLHKDLDAPADAVMQNHARAGRLVAHPQGLKVALPELYGGAMEVYVLDEIWRRDFVINKEAPAEVFGLTGRPRRPRLRLVPRGWHNGMIVVHGLRNIAPALKVAEGWPLSVPELDASTGWVQHHRNQEGKLEVWLASGNRCDKLTLAEGEPYELHANILKPWLLRVGGMELHFETKLILELIGACVSLFMKEGSTQATVKEIRSLVNVMVHINRCSMAGSCLVQPLLAVVMDRQSTHLSLDVGDRMWTGLLTTLLHGAPLQLQVGPAVAPDCGESGGGAMEGAQAAPCFGAARTARLRGHDSKDRAHEAILVVEEFGGAGSLTEALKLLGI
eukprot:s548_g25.t1